MHQRQHTRRQHQQGPASGSARWARTQPGHPLRQPHWVATDRDRLGVQHSPLLSSWARAGTGSDPVARMPGQTPAGTRTLTTPLQTAWIVPPFSGQSLNRNSTQQHARRQRNAPESWGKPRQQPEWHDRNRDTPGKKVEPGGQRRTATRRRRTVIRPEGLAPGAIQTARRLVGAGDRSEDRPGMDLRQHPEPATGRPDPVSRSQSGC